VLEHSGIRKSTTEHGHKTTYECLIKLTLCQDKK